MLLLPQLNMRERVRERLRVSVAARFHRTVQIIREVVRVCAQAVGGSGAGNRKDIALLAALLILLLLILLFGGLGIFVAKVFFIALLVVILVSLATGGMFARGRRR